MNRFDQSKITKNLISLRKAIQNDLQYIVDQLEDQNVFSTETRREITNVRPPFLQLQCGVLINKLLRSGTDAYTKFTTILEDLGHQDIVKTMETSVHKGRKIAWTEDRESTFIVRDLKLPEKSNKSATIKADIDELEDCCIGSRMDEVHRMDGSKTDEVHRMDGSRTDEVHQMERMMTFVLTALDAKDKTNNTIDFKKEFRQTLEEESNGNEELIGFFQTLRYNSFSITSHSLAH